ncbi:Uncharacterized protein Rs2_02850 [Raphanus sativus]|nr:Uncharacterized protein Rs2_02850 [Raphanus sativus]
MEAAPKGQNAEGTRRPPGVKAAKARAKRLLVEEKEVVDFNNMWSIKKEDLAIKEKITKMKLLESLVNKQVPLDEDEEVLRKKTRKRVDELTGVECKRCLVVECKTKMSCSGVVSRTKKWSARDVL